MQTVYAYCIAEGDTGNKALWYRCQCGVVFQESQPAHDGYNENYIADYAEMKEGNTRLIHSARTYANLIEELTYGRMMLDVGYCVPNNMNFWKERGWLTWGIDINGVGSGNLYKGDFEIFDFQMKIDQAKIKEMLGEEVDIKRTFDMIWMGHSLEHFKNPVAALKKAHDLLSDSGLIFIATPDTDFIFKTNETGFPHFKSKEHYIMWNEASLKRELERIGFKIIMSRRNFASRFSSWYDIHIIAQRNFF